VSSRGIWIYLAWLVAIAATVGSLYFSEVRLFVPCTLCWWQRIFMYPLVVVLGVATFRQDHQVWRTALPLSLVGLGTAGYHYLLQKVPAIAPPASCALGVPCNVAYIDWFGFVTIPFLALVAFALITVAMVALLRADPAPADRRPGAPLPTRSAATPRS
jgi:disulfide bond formation protein DsbB